MANNRGNVKDTICWFCKRYCGGCSWTASSVPVKGWKATPHKLQGYHEAMISYRVQECPKFIDDRPTEKPEYSDEKFSPYWCPRCGASISYGIKMCKHCQSSYFDWTDIPKHQPKPLYKPSPKDKRAPKFKREFVVFNVDRFRSLLKEQGYRSAAQYAVLNDIPTSNVHHALHDDHSTLALIERLAMAFGVPVDELIVSKWYPGMKRGDTNE